MKPLCSITVSLVFVACATASLSAQEKPRTLMGRIADWRYPNAEFKGAEMADGNTINSQGERTVPSVSCKTLMITDDDIDQVLEFYKSKLQPIAEDNTSDVQQESAAGKSVVFHDDSADRPFAMHVITVNSDQTSTSLIITRGKDEAKTYIAWKQYERLTVRK